MSIRPNTPSLHDSVLVAVLVLICLMATAARTPAQSLTKVPFPYSPINTSALPFMLAKDAKIFEKYGLDVDLILYKPRLLRRVQLIGVSKGGEHPLWSRRGSNPAREFN